MSNESPIKRRVVVELQELIAPDVTHISLVERGANRQPFKITKAVEELPAMNFKNLFGRKKTDENTQAPQLAMILVAEGANTESLVGQIGEMPEFKIKSKVDMGEGIVGLLLLDEAFDMDDALVVKSNEEVAVVVLNARKALDSFPQSSDYMENVNATGFFPGFHIGLDTLAMTVSNVLGDARTKDEGVAGIEAAVESFKSHVEALIAVVPQQAFKLETLFAEAAAIKGDVSESDDDVGDVVATAVAAAKAAVDAVSDTAEAPPVEVVQAAAETTATKADEDASPGEAADINGVLETMTATLMTSVSEQMGALRDELVASVTKANTDTDGKVNALAGSVESLATAVAEGESQRQKLDEAVNGTAGEGATGAASLADNIGSNAGMNARRKALLAEGDNVSPGTFDNALQFPGEVTQVAIPAGVHVSGL